MLLRKIPKTGIVPDPKKKFDGLEKIFPNFSFADKFVFNSPVRASSSETAEPFLETSI